MDDAVKKKGAPEVLKVTGESAQVCHDVTGTLETTEVVEKETLEAASESQGTSQPTSRGFSGYTTRRFGDYGSRRCLGNCHSNR